MSFWKVVAPAVAGILTLCAGSAPAEQTSKIDVGETRSLEQDRAVELFRSIEWQQGPGVADLGAVAEIRLPEGYQFTGREGARIFQELSENPPSDHILGVLTPVGALDWFIVFEYNETGYLRDAEKDRIDGDALLQAIRRGTEASNEYRRNKGWAEIKDVVWEHRPEYDAASHHLVWATGFRSEGSRTINYSTRVLGRRGVISVSLVTVPELYRGIIPTIQDLIRKLDFKSGLRYSEFQAGDQVAGYGLTALITGGAEASAFKTGLLAKFGMLLSTGGKLILGGILALCAMIIGSWKKTSP